MVSLYSNRIVSKAGAPLGIISITVGDSTLANWSLGWFCALRTCSPACSTVGRQWSLSGAGPSERRLGHWRYRLEEDTGTQSIPDSSSVS